jgi:hypothetical protein
MHVQIKPCGFAGWLRGRVVLVMQNATIVNIYTFSLTLQLAEPAEKVLVFCSETFHRFRVTIGAASHGL